MAFDRANLPTDTGALHRIILAQAAEAEAREAELAAAKVGLMAKALEIEKYKLQIARLQRMQFGRSSEKIARTIEQFELRLEELATETPAASSEASAAPDEPSPPIERPSSSGGKKSERRALPAHLSSRDVVHTPNCTCPVCGGEMRKVGGDVTRILGYIPGHFEAIRHVRPAFSCRRCESMVQGPMPCQLRRTAPRSCAASRAAATQCSLDRPPSNLGARPSTLRPLRSIDPKLLSTDLGGADPDRAVFPYDRRSSVR